MAASDRAGSPAHPLLGKWRIVETDQWDSDYLDMVEPAFIRLDGADGEIRFGCLEAALD